MVLFGVVLSGGIHRIAQSTWDCPHVERNKIIFLYFSLDNALPANGHIKIDFPKDFSHVPTRCDVWEIKTSLDYPDSGRYYGVISGVSPIFYCVLSTSSMSGFG